MQGYILGPFCPACKHTEPCHGGGDKGCIKRHPLPSVVAGIIDTYGGMRVVVTHRNKLRNHVRPDELCIVCPKLLVHEPIAWNDIPVVIARAELEIEKWIAARGIPNDPIQRECVVMYKLRCLENRQSKGSLDINAIAYT